MKRMFPRLWFAIFFILTILIVAIHKIGWDYLRSPHSDIVDFKLNPVPQPEKGDAI